jgi:LPS-assembly protein
VPSQTFSSNYFSETISTFYLTGQRDRRYFDLHGYSFEGLLSHEDSPAVVRAANPAELQPPQQPIAHPVWTTTKPSTSTLPNPSASAGKPSSTSI